MEGINMEAICGFCFGILVMSNCFLIYLVCSNEKKKKDASNNEDKVN